MNYFIKIKDGKGKEQLVQLDPTKVEVMQGPSTSHTSRHTTVVPSYKAISSSAYLKASEKEFNNISILPSSFKNVVPTQLSTNPIVMSESTSPTIQGPTTSRTSSHTTVVPSYKATSSSAYGPTTSRTTVVPSYKATSSSSYLKASEKEFNNISILPSSSKNVVPTQFSTYPIVMSESTSPTIQDINNHQVLHSIDLNTMLTTSTFPLAIPSSHLSSNSVNDEGKSDVTKENWTDAEIQLLLEQRLSMNDKFENPNSRKTPYWNLIAKVFEEKGYKVTKQDLVNKWKNLQVTYNRNASKLRKTGESAITWKYFHQMHEVFAEKKSVNPPEESLGSTFKSETLILKDELPDDTSQEEIDGKTNILQKGKKRKLSKTEKTQFQEEMLRIVEEKKSQSLKLKKEIWEDKKKIAMSKIETMNNLVAVLKDLQNNRTT